MIFEQLSLEYFLAGKTLPWNKVRNPEKPGLIWAVAGQPLQGTLGDIVGVKADMSKSESQYFNLRG